MLAVSGSNAGLIVAAPSQVGATAKRELGPDAAFSLLLDEPPTTRVTWSHHPSPPNRARP